MYLFIINYCLKQMLIDGLRADPPGPGGLALITDPGSDMETVECQFKLMSAFGFTGHGTTRAPEAQVTNLIGLVLSAIFSLWINADSVSGRSLSINWISLFFS